MGVYLCSRKQNGKSLTLKFTTMKLAEALSLRADLQKRISELRTRLKTSGKVTEGDEPAEDVKTLFTELDDAFVQLEDLIYRINETNTRTVCDGETITRIMARKDVLSMRVNLLREVLNHVMGKDNRYGRNELREIRLIDVSELRKETDNCSKKLRELDMKLQNLNWTTDLI